MKQLKSLESGLVLGYVLERVEILNSIELVVQFKNSRFFIKVDKNFTDKYIITEMNI